MAFAQSFVPRFGETADRGGISPAKSLDIRNSLGGLFLVVFFFGRKNHLDFSRGKCCYKTSEKTMLVSHQGFKLVIFVSIFALRGVLVLIGGCHSMTVKI